MNACERHEQTISTWLDGELDRSGQVEMIDHIARCEACREFYIEARALEGLVATMRTPQSADAPAPETWWQITRRLEQVAPRPRRRLAIPSWTWQLAAILVIGAALWLRAVPPTATAPPDAEIRLAENAGQMDESRFLDLTRELLRSDPRYLRAMHGVLDQVMLDTGTSEASSEGSAEREGNHEIVEIAAGDPA